MNKSIIKQLGIIPGWYVDKDNNVCVDVDRITYTLTDSHTQSEKEKANNRLIAAAPEMLEALIALAKYTPSTWRCGNVDIEAILEKALGLTWEEIRRKVDE